VSRTDKNHFRRSASWPEAHLRRLAEVAREIKCRRNGVYRLSDAARAAFREGIDAAEAGHFAPEDEMDEFYRLHRNP
jgi:predicted transcriptional regulator